MAKAQICLCFIIFFYLSSGNLMRANAQSPGDWCVAKPSTDDAKLLKNINFACDKIDCRSILKGGACFFPDTLFNHASVAMNMYYQAQGRHFWNCNFEGSGIIAITDPSYGNCKYQFRK